MVVPRLFWGIYVKRTFISAAAILAFAATAAHADELSDIQAQAKQIREQNAAMTKRLADLEKRQKALEAQKPVDHQPGGRDGRRPALQGSGQGQAARRTTTSASRAFAFTATSTWASPTSSTAPVQRRWPAVRSTTLIEKNSQRLVLRRRRQPDEHLVHRSARQAGDRRQPVRRVQLADPVQPGQRHECQRHRLASCRTTAWSGPHARHVRRTPTATRRRRGQMFNNAAYFGISSPTYGTFTMGRQCALSSDLVVNYDPLSGSNAWSLITYEGATGGGGDTENRIYDNSYEYRLNVGPVRLAAEAQLRNGGNSSHRQRLRRRHRLRLHGLLDGLRRRQGLRRRLRRRPLELAQVNVTQNQAA